MTVPASTLNFRKKHPDIYLTSLLQRGSTDLVCPNSTPGPSRCARPHPPLVTGTSRHPTAHARNRRRPNSSFPHTPCPVSQQILPARWNPRPHTRPCSCPGPHHLSPTCLILTASKLVFLLPLFPHPGLFPHSS